MSTPCINAAVCNLFVTVDGQRSSFSFLLRFLHNSKVIFLISCLNRAQTG